MNPIFFSIISKSISVSVKQVESTVELLNEGATIPFISRYRKERTGALDEVAIAAIQEQYEKLCEMEKRKGTILSTIEEQGNLTGDLRQRIEGCWNSTELEDIYLPFKPKRRTRGQIAREKGLEPLAKLIMGQRERDITQRAERFVKDEVKDLEDALKGAKDIVAEMISENETARNIVRSQFEREAVISSKVVKGKEAEAEKYRDYFAFEEPLRRCSSHRLLAMRRGEKEGFLKVSLTPNDEKGLERLGRFFVKGNGEASALVEEAMKDSYKRLIRPSIETEFGGLSKEKADEEAIRVFAENLRQLLLAAPLGEKRVMGVDPGFRTGCKIVCCDAQGNLLHNDTIYPHLSQNEKAAAMRKLSHMVEAYDVEAIAIGNGTASRETETFVKQMRFPREVQVYVVSESGASIYSASKLAREEFPDYDVTVRGAVSIGRRLMDPLAELVKIDPKSIGVGQYQHDVDQAKLKRSLDQTVENCVNLVGVNVNTASKYLLTYISGLGPTLAQNIVEYRRVNGAFATRRELMKVPRMGDKAFEQAAGFLRIAGGKHPLDNSAVHPESYVIVERMAKELGVTVEELIRNKELKKGLKLESYVTEKVGMLTLKDIVAELDKPGRDPRQQIKMFEFDANLKTLDDLHEGMVVPGIINNMTNFGCFVEIGIKENGLIHVSHLADRFVKDPTEVVKMHQHVMVKVIGIDRERRRVQLSMKGIEQSL